MKKEIVLNLNDVIKVKLTSYGKQVFYSYWNIVPTPSLNIDEDGYTQFQLWEFINIFGSYIYMGAKNVIEPLEIIKEI